MAAQEKFLSKRQRYQPISLLQSFLDKQMVKDWALSESDREAVKMNQHNCSNSLTIDRLKKRT